MAFQPSNFLLGLPGTVYGAIATVPTGAVITSDGGGPTADVSVGTGDTAVTTVTASGTGTEVFSISGGAEANMFTINSGSGALAFTTTSVDGEYEVIVKATNDWGSDTQTITVTVAEAYEGPLDLVPGAIVAWSQRAMEAGSTADAITIRRSSDDATQIFALVDNEVDAAAVTTFLGGSNPFVTAWKDQSGNASHVVQATAGKQPAWSPSQFGALPAVLFTRASATLLGTAGDVVFPVGQFTAFVVAKRGAGIGNSSAMFGGDFEFAGTDEHMSFSYGTSNDIVFEVYDTDGSNVIGAAMQNPVAPDGSYHIYEIAMEFGSRDIKIDGADQTADSVDSGSSFANINMPMAVGSSDVNTVNTSYYWDGFLAELIIYNSVLSDPNRLSIRQNIAAYYGITL